MDDPSTQARPTSARWFACAAVVISAASLAGAQGLAWLSAPGRLSVVTATASQVAPRKSPDPTVGVDDTPTGSIPSSALVIRLR